MATRPTRTLTRLAALPLALAACTGPSPAPSPDAPVTTTPVTTPDAPASAAPSPGTGGGTSAGTAQPGGEASTLGVDPAVVEGVRTLCAPGPGKTVEEFPDVEIPAVSWAATSVPGGRAGDVEVAPIDVPAVELPATIAEAGCVVTYEAPAGCLAKVEFSAAWIPSVRVPGYSVTQPDGTVDDVPAQEQPAQVVEGKVVDQKCQVVTEASKSGVIRSGLIRSGLIRSGIIRSGTIRSAATAGSEGVRAASVPAKSIPAVSLQARSVAAESLPYERLTDGVNAARSEATATYEAAESVLFEYNSADLLPSANAALDAVLTDARAKGFDGLVRVEGHTDDTGPEAGNQSLSEARAQAVADYLAGHGVPAERITATGFGEALPAHPNDSEENRAKNRRVVIEFASA